MRLMIQVKDHCKTVMGCDILHSVPDKDDDNRFKLTIQAQGLAADVIHFTILMSRADKIMLVEGEKALMSTDVVIHSIHKGGTANMIVDITMNRCTQVDADSMNGKQVTSKATA